MKKVLVWLLACTLLIGLCAIPASAEAALVIAGDNEGDVDDVLEITVSLAEVPEFDSMSIDVTFDHEVLDYDPDESGWDDTNLSKKQKKGVQLTDFVEANNRGVFAYDSTKASGEVLEGDIDEIFYLALAIQKTDGTDLTVKITGKNGAAVVFEVTDTFAINGGAPAGGEELIEGRTVIFEDEFSSRYVIPEEDVVGKEVTFTINGEDAATETVEVDGHNYVTAISPKVKPGAINTVFTVKVFVDGVETETYEDSIYEALKKAAAGTNETLANAAKATLAFCQQAAAINGIPGTNYTEGIGAVADHVYDQIATHRATTGPTDVKIVATSLYLKGEGIYVNFYVDPQSYTGTLDDTTLYIGGVAKTATKKVNGDYWVYSIPVDLADMDQNMVAEIYAGGVAISRSYTNSVVAYAADLAETNPALAQAIMNYVYYAKAATASLAAN